MNRTEGSQVRQFYYFAFARLQTLPSRQEVGSDLVLVDFGQFQRHAQVTMRAVNDLTSQFSRKLNMSRTTRTGYPENLWGVTLVDFL